VPARQNLRNCRPKPIAPTRQSQAETCCITHRGASSVIRQPSSRNDFNPNSRTFSIAARIRPTSGFLQVSLSKIRGYIDVGLSCTWLAADFRSTLATTRQLNSNSSCCGDRSRPYRSGRSVRRSPSFRLRFRESFTSQAPYAAADGKNSKERSRS